MCDANSNYPMGVNGSHPHFDQPDPPECPNPKCWAELKEEWRFCPMCGKRIDWGHWRDTTEPDIDAWRDR